MEPVFFLVMRRMRAPLLTLVVAYAVAMLGLVLIPGTDGDGNPYRLDFFHAFYFVSYMATTIGFGEIPHAFNGAQRLWVVFTIYSTVVVWVYAIGTIISLFQDPAFRRAMTRNRFLRRVRRMREGFYLICGYGETGSALVRALTDQGQHAVVVEILPERVDMLRMENLRDFVPALCADASRPASLRDAGLEHDLCKGVVALTNVNEVNLKVAITSKLLHPSIQVICRADSKDVEKNMASFGTDYIVDPFDTFALHLAIAYQAPCLYVLQQWLAGEEDRKLCDPIYPPREGRWVVCGFGRFGKAVLQRLRFEGLDTVVVEASPWKTGTPKGTLVHGRGTEAETLEEAGIREAAGLVAGTDDDANNLSIIMTARELNPNLFVVARQNLSENQSIIEAVKADMVMHPSFIIANKIQALLAAPMLDEFFSLSRYQTEAWACELVSRIAAVTTARPPEVWELWVEEDYAFAVVGALHQGRVVCVGDLLRDPRDRGRELPCIALMLISDEARTLLPDPETRLHPEDRILFCGRPESHNAMRWTLMNEHALFFVTTGESRPQGWLWGRLRGRAG